ncbi:sulfotransferase [Phycicoccus endophyticus]|uniref:Sulfotransferase n=1 Tax=Phycicoccus endophyticus TaxID=1690220 RepID=A0A7G9R2U1_9MICO|nr:hypothetical protein [Phycicoccus endophyticus]QNN49916.1 sulfotransferase [Phycicoccus endophyticus]GGL29635.1 hypothetical protein GCM10012283_10010 [Phycicoccus endophyticus]
MDLKPIILVGAARSGTKALRDALAMASGVDAVPYDVTYVWRYGNDAMPHDRQLPAHAKPKTSRMVHTFFRRYANADGRLVEKTVGTSLRVGYVSTLMPGASFVHLIRDGVDVAESSRRQWLAPAELGYLREKVRHFPLRLLASYGRRFVRWNVAQRLRGDDRVASWGPRYPGMDSDVVTERLLTVCARQWANSVTLALADFRDYQIPHVEVRYEDLVADPARVLRLVLEFSGLEPRDEDLRRGAATITGGHGSRSSLDEAELRLLDTEIGELQVELGYRRPLDEIRSPDA